MKDTRKLVKLTDRTKAEICRTIVMIVMASM